MANSTIDATTMIIFVLETWDRSSNKPTKIGFSNFNLFLNKTTLLPCTEKADSQFMLNDGMYQLPIFNEDPDISAPLTYTRFDPDKLERIPTASLLIRCFKAPVNAGG
jgi:hypothetical protein